LNTVTQIPALQRHLREHPPDWLLREAKVGYQAPARAIKRPIGSPRIASRKSSKTEQRTPEKWLTDTEEAAIAHLPMPGQLKGQPL